jgi:hypothetical protein
MRFSPIIPALALALVLTACGSAKEDNRVTETRMDTLDSLEGTISDDMINTDALNEEVPVEAVPAAPEPTVREAPKDDAVQTDPDAAADTPKVETPSEPK